MLGTTWNMHHTLRGSAFRSTYRPTMRPISAMVLPVVVCFAVLAGIYYRVMRLDLRLFWYDECYTALKLSGHRDYVASEHILDGQIRPIAEVRRYQRLDPE